jgi:hypothetical protein
LPEPPSQERSACPLGRPGDALRPFGRREPPPGACGAGRHLRSSSVLVDGPDSSRCRIPSSSTTAFNRGSCHPLRVVRHGDRLGGTYRRPPTSCAHRLRKPNHTDELLALSVARRTGCCGLLPAYRRRHRARPAAAAVGLGRRPPDEPERLPSERLEPCGPSRLGSARCSRASPRPAPCRPPRAPSTSSKVGRSPRAIQEERCVSPTSAIDFHNEHPADRSIPGCTLARASPCGVSRPGTGSPWAFAPRRRGWGACRTLTE